jgi:hypothetical protein
MKIREGMARDDYSDPGPYKNPPGTVAYEVDAPAAEPVRPQNDKDDAGAAKIKGMKGMKMKGM